MDKKLTMRYTDIITTLQTYNDCKDQPSSQSAQIFAYDKENPKEMIARIKQLQEDGHGIFWCVNPQVIPNERSIANTKEWKCVGMDCDMIPQKELSTITQEELDSRKRQFIEVIHNLEFPPTGLIESHKGFYPYWIFTDGLPVTDAEEVNLNYRDFVKRLGDKIGYYSEGDNVARVLRVSNTKHLKHRDRPFQIKEVENVGNTYDYKELSSWIGFDTWIKREEPKELIAQRDYKSIYDVPIMDALKAVSGTALVAGETYTFVKSGQDKFNVYIDGQISSNFIDINNNSIGKTGGNATPNIVDWCKWYADNGQTTLTKENIRVTLDAILLGSNFEARTWDEIASKEQEQVDSFAKLIQDNIWTEARIMSAEVPKDRYLIDEMIPRGCVFLSGAPKSLKSYISLHIIDCLVNAKKAFGHFNVPQQRKVLVMDRENQMWAVRERILQITCGLGEMVNYLDVRTSFTNPEFRKALLEYIRTNKYEVIFMDSFRRFYTGNENASELIADFFLFIDEIKAIGCSVICIHHFNKNAEAVGSSKIRGSSDIVAYYDANINFKKKLDGGVTILELEQTENRMDKELSPFTVNVIESEDNKLSFGFGEFIEPEVSAQDDANREIIKLLIKYEASGEGRFADEIRSELKHIKPCYINSGLPKLVRSGKVRVDKIDRKNVYTLGTKLMTEGGEK